MALVYDDCSIVLKPISSQRINCSFASITNLQIGVQITKNQGGHQRF
jgi:hypothetical protein